MTQETLQPSQRARDHAAELARIMKCRTCSERGDMIQGRVDDDDMVDAFARFERFLSEHDSRVKELVEAATRVVEAAGTRGCFGGNVAWWEKINNLRTALNGGSDADKPDEDDWGCDYCRNDGPLTDAGGTSRCPKCDAEYPDGGSDAE